MPPGVYPPARSRTRFLIAAGLFAGCCLTDALVLRPVWLSGSIADDQFRRGYFERFADEVEIAMDGAVRPNMLPAFLLTDEGRLGIPPGMTAAAELTPGTAFELRSDSDVPPYIVIGSEVPIPPDPAHGLEREATRLVGSRTPSLVDGRLVLTDWDPARPWHEDADRLMALSRACGAGAAAQMRVSLSDRGLAVAFGHCTVTEPLSIVRPRLAVAALAGPAWATMARIPGWRTEHRIVWVVLGVIAVKNAALWWALGAPAAAALAVALALAALWAPIQATLTWPVALGIGLVAALIRLAIAGWRVLPPRWRIPAGAIVLAIPVYANLTQRTKPPPSHPIMRLPGALGPPDRCAVIGYSTVKGEGLREDRGGIRWLLDDACEPCRHTTAALFAGGETLAWARDVYCASAPTFGADGTVVFLGAANDDFMWGTWSLARWMLIGNLGPQSWHDNVTASASASRARIAEQLAALEQLIGCAHARGARFVFLHDFLSTDLSHGRERDRAAMLAERRAAVQETGSRFVDLYAAFRDEAGITWFNDYVHLSLIGHEHVSKLACEEATK
jgi:hypothetical protein